MLRTRTSICLLIAAATLSTHAQDTDKSEKGLMAVEHAWYDAEGPALRERIYAPDFVHIVADGRIVSRESELAYFRKQKPATPEEVAQRNAHHHFEDVKVRIYGDIGIVDGRTVITDVQGQVVRKTSFTDIFVWRDGRWQVINAQETPLEKQYWGDKPGN